MDKPYYRAKISFGTVSQPYPVGYVFEPNPQCPMWEAMGWIEQTDELPTHIKQFLDRLDQGAGTRALFLPHLGEFGHRVMTGCRLIHFHRAEFKVVCCRPGEEVLYPSAAAFVTDWKSPYPDRTVAGSMKSPKNFWPQIIEKFRDCTPFEQGGLTPAQELLVLRPHIRIPFAPKLPRGPIEWPDVLIGTRARQLHASKNWPRDHFQTVADAIRAEGLTFATIGAGASSFHLDGELWHSTDFGHRCTDVAIEAMRRALLWFSTDTGTAHLAAAVGACQMVILRAEHFGRDFLPMMEQIAGRPIVRCEHWTDPHAVARDVLSTLVGV